MTREEAIDVLRHNYPSPCFTFLCEAVEIAIEALSAEPECNLDEWCHDCKEYDKEKNRCPRWNRVIRTALEEAQPERKKGKWIDDGWHGDWAWETDGHGNCWHLYRCSLCNTKVKAMSKFCPNCGAYMRGDEHEAD